MNVRRFSDPDAFYQHVEAFLIAREAENNLIFGVLNGVRGGEWRAQPPYMACVERNGEVVLAALRTPPFNLIISPTDTPEAIPLLAQDVRAVFERLPGLVAPSGYGAPFAQQWQALTGQTYRLAMAQRIYQLDRVNPVRGVPGALRPLKAADHELFKRWMLDFQQEAFGEVDEERIEQAVQRYLTAPPELRGLFFWEVDGQPVSMAAYSGPTPNGFRVGAVYTPPELRRRGYAGACVAALSQRLLDGARKHCFLFTDLSNPTSNHIYQEIGYRPVCDVDDYRFEG